MFVERSACSKLNLYATISQKWLVGSVVTKQKIDEAASIIDGHLGPGLFNYDGDCNIYVHVTSAATHLISCTYSVTNPQVFTFYVRISLTFVIFL